MSECKNEIVNFETHRLRLLKTVCRKRKKDHAVIRLFVHERVYQTHRVEVLAATYYVYNIFGRKSNYNVKTVVRWIKILFKVYSDVLLDKKKK